MGSFFPCQHQHLGADGAPGFARAHPRAARRLASREKCGTSWMKRRGPLLEAMAWSLSQEDDGLEPVSGEALAETHLAAQRDASGKGSEGSPASSSRPIAPPRFADVTPASRGGERPGTNPPPSRQRAQEPTLVLRDRQLDSLRAEVKRHRQAAERRQSLTMVLWGVAGGIAVLIGALMARALTRSSSEQLGAVHSERTEIPLARKEEPRRPTESEMKKAELKPSVAKKSADSDRRRALSLDELPTE